MDTAHELLHIDKWTVVHRKIMDIPTRFILIIIFMDVAFEYGSCWTFRLIPVK
jgi:hypothetical protein